MVLRAAGYLVREGPATPQERWEENSGYSPSSLAANIAALACAAEMARERGDDHVAGLPLGVRRLSGSAPRTLVRDHREHAGAGHLAALHPHSAGRHRQSAAASKIPNRATVLDQEPAAGRAVFVSGEGDRRRRLFGAGALRHSQSGRSADRRFAAGRRQAAEGRHAARALLAALQPRRLRSARRRRALYRLGTRPGLAAADRRAGSLRTGGRPRRHALHPRDRGLCLLGAFCPSRCGMPPICRRSGSGSGCPTGAAMPLVWAHAEYLTLLRSLADGQVYDYLPHVAERYCGGKKPPVIEFWKPNRHATRVAGRAIRCACRPLRRSHLRWTSDEWKTVHDTPAGVDRAGHFVCRSADRATISVRPFASRSAGATTTAGKAATIRWPSSVRRWPCARSWPSAYAACSGRARCPVAASRRFRCRLSTRVNRRGRYSAHSPQLVAAG